MPAARPARPGAPYGGRAVIAPTSAIEPGTAHFRRGIAQRRLGAMRALGDLGILPRRARSAMLVSADRARPMAPAAAPHRGLRHVASAPDPARAGLGAAGPAPATGPRPPGGPKPARGTPVPARPATCDLLGRLLWLPLGHGPTAACALGVAVGIGAAHGLQERLLPLYGDAWSRWALVAVTLALPLLRAADDYVQRRWRGMRDRDLEHLMTEQLAGEARLAEDPDAQVAYVSTLQKLRVCLDDLAELLRDLGRDVGTIGQAVAYLAAHWCTITWQILVLQLIGQAIGTAAAAIWRARVQRREASLQDRRDIIDHRMIPVHSYGTEADYRRWRDMSAAARRERAAMGAGAGWVKLVQAGAPALSTVAILIGSGWLAAAAPAAATFAGVASGLAASFRLAEALMKAPRRFLTLRDLRGRMAARIERIERVRRLDLAAHVDLSLLHASVDGHVLSPAELGLRLQAGTPGRVTLRGANGAGKSSLMALLRMAFAERAALVPTHPRFVHADEGGDHRSTGTTMNQRLQVVAGPPAPAADVLLFDEWAANLDPDRRQAFGHWLDTLAEVRTVVETVHHGPRARAW